MVKYSTAGRFSTAKETPRKADETIVTKCLKNEDAYIHSRYGQDRHDISRKNVDLENRFFFEWPMKLTARFYTFDE